MYYEKKIFLETNDASLLKYINRMYLDKDTLFVFDRALGKVVIFNTNGKYLNSICNIGGGLGEYAQTMDFFVDKDNRRILLLCDLPCKIIWYDYNGEFVKEEPFKFTYSQLIANNDYIYCDRPETSTSNTNEYQLGIFTHDFEPINDILLLREKNNISLFSSDKSLTKSQGKLFYTRRFDNAIYSLENGGISVKYTINFNEHNLPETVLKMNYTIPQFMEVCSKQKYVFAITGCIENENYFLFNTNIGTFVWDKQKNELNGYSFTRNTYNDLLSSNYQLLGDKIAYVYNPSDILKIRERIEKHEHHDVHEHDHNHQIKPELFEILSKVSVDDNPLIYIYELK
ncbi:6-bladed beta-propeller [Viscerimonas tarda]